MFDMNRFSIRQMEFRKNLNQVPEKCQIWYDTLEKILFQKTQIKC